MSDHGVRSEVTAVSGGDRTAQESLKRAFQSWKMLSLRDVGRKWTPTIFSINPRRAGFGLVSFGIKGATWRSICCLVRPSLRKCLTIVLMWSWSSSDITRRRSVFVAKCKRRLGQYVPDAA